MEEAVRATLQAQLLDRRQKLGSAMEESGEASQLVHLLTEVDAALERLDSGSYGICRVCHDPIEERLLLADPLVQTCLDHLSQAERRALERDLELAHAIQLKLLPRRSLGFGGWEVCYHFAPAGAVSGDYRDVVTPESTEGAMLVALGDMSGKGVAASMLMAHLNALVRTLAERREPLPTLVGQVNRAFCESTLPAHYASLVCGGLAQGRLSPVLAPPASPFIQADSRPMRANVSASTSQRAGKGAYWYWKREERQKIGVRP